MELKKEILKLCAQRGFLIDKELLEFVSEFDFEFVKRFLLAVFDIKQERGLISLDFIIDNFELLKEKFGGDKDFIIFSLRIGFSDKDFSSEIKKEYNVNISSNFNRASEKLEVLDFLKYFRSRFDMIRKFFEDRGIKNLRSIRRIGTDRESFDIIAMVANKSVTKNKNLIFEVEDVTGKIKVLVNSNKINLYEKCKNILPDDVLGFRVSGNREMLFVEDVLFPDCGLVEKKKIKDDIFSVFISDVHVGSRMFLEKNFIRFIRWINGQDGTCEERESAKKIKYLFLVGDNVDGVGVFPEQEKLLEIKDVFLQYKKLADLLRMIRKDVNIIICPGQHDACWVGEPQKLVEKGILNEFLEMKNVSFVSNPGVVEIEGKIKVLMYHGASFHSVVEEMNDMRIKYKYNSPTMIVKELLKRRHLAPIHGSCDYVPGGEKDFLVVDSVPDIVVTGDLHRAEVSSYNNILLVSCSCWQSITPFEEKVGNNPEPCKVPVLNLKTREIKIMDFSDREKDTEVRNG